MKNFSEMAKKSNIISKDPNNEINIADLNIHSARCKFLLPKALAVAPLIAPPNAPLDNILVNMKMGKIYATPANSVMPIFPIYQRSNITVLADKKVAHILGMANLKKILLNGNSINSLEIFFLLKTNLSRLIYKF